MLDYVGQGTLSLPYPGWEDFYKPWDGRVIQTATNQSSETQGKRGSCAEDVVEVPSWAIDVDGYCCFLKDIGPVQ